jgi:hypothetical protein
MSWLRKEHWPWWQAGLLLGLLNMAAFFNADYYLSVSTTFSRGAGMLVGLVAPEHVAANAYWQKVKPIVDWQFMLVLGIPIGAGLYSEVYPLIQNNFLKLGDFGKLTIPAALDVNTWAVIVPLVAVMGFVLLWFEKKGL